MLSALFNFSLYQNSHVCLRFYKDSETCGREKIFLVSKLYGGKYSASRPGRFNPERERALIQGEAGLAPKLVRKL
jgi:hypothetical protein